MSHDSSWFQVERPGWCQKCLISKKWIIWISHLLQNYVRWICVGWANSDWIFWIATKISSNLIGAETSSLGPRRISLSPIPSHCWFRQRCRREERGSQLEVHCAVCKRQNNNWRSPIHSPSHARPWRTSAWRCKRNLHLTDERLICFFKIQGKQYEEPTGRLYVTFGWDAIILEIPVALSSMAMSIKDSGIQNPWWMPDCEYLGDVGIVVIEFVPSRVHAKQTSAFGDRQQVCGLHHISWQSKLPTNTIRNI